MSDAQKNLDKIIEGMYGGIDSPFLMNRLGNCNNSYQGEAKRVLCVCSAGLLRSPTAAFVLSNSPWNYNTRAAGLTPQFALIPVDKVLLTWSQEIGLRLSVVQALRGSRRRSPHRALNINLPDSKQ